MAPIIKHVSLILVFCALSNTGQTQSCCSGGVPLSGNIGLPAGEIGTWQIAMTYDLNTLKTLKSGNETLDDRLRARKTHSILLETGYTFSSKWSADLFMSFIRQERHIFSFAGTQSTITNGLGDAVVLLKYRITGLESPITWIVGAGPKIPLGNTDQTNKNGISLSADLQPGSGSWDGIIWSSLDYALPFRKSLTLSATSTWKLNGKNNEYLGSIVYQFGNEYQLSVGFADKIALGRVIIDPSISLRYRRAGRDINDNQEIEATGGQWLFILPAINVPVSQSLAFNVSISLPVYSFVNNTQLTPTNRFTAGLFLKINKPQNP
jgi:hypothetical protein